MNYPTMDEVNNAAPRQIVEWYHDLPTARTPEESVLITAIYNAYHELPLTSKEA